MANSILRLIFKTLRHLATRYAHVLSYPQQTSDLESILSPSYDSFRFCDESFSSKPSSPTSEGPYPSNLLNGLWSRVAGEGWLRGNDTDEKSIVRAGGASKIAATMRLE